MSSTHCQPSSESESEEHFYDTRAASVSDCSEEDSTSCSGCPNCLLNDHVWSWTTTSLETAPQRRQRFLNWIHSNLDDDHHHHHHTCAPIIQQSHSVALMELDATRLSQESGAVLRRNTILEEEDESPLYSGRTSMSSCSADQLELLRPDNLLEASLYQKDRNLSSNVSTSPQYNQGATTLGASLSIQPSVQKDGDFGNLLNVKRSLKPSWFKKLTVKARSIGRQGEASVQSSEEGARFQRVKVHASVKKVKELSSLYAGQELPAHEGSISTIKFSPDGQFLASAGKDSIVRVWKVAEVERPDKLLVSPDATKDNKFGNMKRLKKSPESASVIVPSKVFCVIEEPLHEFRGHKGEVLALSWSKNGLLLSSSVDKTVRLWKLGSDECLSVFSHNNYVTCVDFNPVDDNHFISGSIDGKVRVWSVHSCRVVHWIDTREIVSAVCYYPSGEGAIVGSVDGSCYFYDIQDQQFQLDSQTCLPGKKKLPSKRITGFQFNPSDPAKVLVTSADSQVRLLCGVDVVSKFKGHRVSGSQATASFTTDGKHVVSACEDAMISVWDYVSPGKASMKAKKMDSSESFFSQSASIAVPWCGLNKPVATSISNPVVEGDNLGSPHCKPDLLQNLASSPPDCFSLSLGLLLDSLPKGTATWPEEKLSSPSMMEEGCSPIFRPTRIFRNNFQSTCGSDLWGLVIVTAGQDGKIRTFQNFGLPIRL